MPAGIFVIRQFTFAFATGLFIERNWPAPINLTAANGRTFYETVSLIVSMPRDDRPITLAYLDLDNFK